MAARATKRRPYQRRPAVDDAPPQAGANGLAEWIKANRAAQELSQRDLAQRASISRSYLCDIEHGRGTQPSIAVLDKLASALGATRAEILRASGILRDAAVDEHSDEHRLLAIFRDLSEEGRLAVERFARFVHGEEHRYVQPPLVSSHAPSNAPSQDSPQLFDDLESDHAPSSV